MIDGVGGAPRCASPTNFYKTYKFSAVAITGPKQPILVMWKYLRQIYSDCLLREL